MTTNFTVTQARTQLFDLMKQATTGYKKFTITSKSGDAVLISSEEYESLIETLELLSQPGFRQSIEEAKDDISQGRTVSIDDAFGV